MKVWECRTIAYILKIPYPRYPFFSHLTKFQKCMFKRIHHVFTSLGSPTRAPYNKNLHIDVHSALIEYENRKAKPTHYLVQLTNLEDLNDR